VDVSDNTSGPQGTSKQIEVANIKGYKVYTALLTQTGNTNPPTAIVLENTLGFTPTFSRASEGGYFIESSSGFTINKTFLIIGSCYENGDPASFNGFGIAQVIDSSNINLSTARFTTDGLESRDSWLSNTPIEIRIYN
jgi:hypothetical protein